jgi:hypothetical protein
MNFHSFAGLFPKVKWKFVFSGILKARQNGVIDTLISQYAVKKQIFQCIGDAQEVNARQIIVVFFMFATALIIALSILVIEKIVKFLNQNSWFIL